MVIFFKSEVVSPSFEIYMGVDKHENEDLIKFGFPEDIWFHVDKLSSAHVYLRLHKDMSIEDIPSAVLEDCAQLVKANSIQGCKINNVGVVYTPWANLKKTGDMAIGQVGFHRHKEVRTIKVEKKIGDIVNRLNKTKEVREVDVKEEREKRDRREREDQKKVKKEEKKQEKLAMKQKQEQDELRSYSSLMQSDNMKSNREMDSDASDEFM
ncbi:coiled-coil domain-containing protein 25-like [Apostichopus japonicus]|uniref:coiled-coil domain-containing protein 25-like n=1 Tax=Stichopus japonicus TaxID=307972 RepID=UPI003AB8CE2B